MFKTCIMFLNKSISAHQRPSGERNSLPFTCHYTPTRRLTSVTSDQLNSLGAPFSLVPALRRPSTSSWPSSSFTSAFLFLATFQVKPWKSFTVFFRIISLTFHPLFSPFKIFLQVLYHQHHKDNDVAASQMQ